MTDLVRSYVGTSRKSAANASRAVFLFVCVFAIHFGFANVIESGGNPAATRRGGGPLLTSAVSVNGLQVPDQRDQQAAKAQQAVKQTKTDQESPQLEGDQQSARNAAAPKSSGKKPLPFRTLNLFDGKSLDGWEKTTFGGEGDIRAEGGHLVVEAGYPMSGFNSTLRCLPTRDYEFHVEARKSDGIDFFVGLTFPVNDSHCTFIVGGWAGSVVGLSCIDGKDAARNDTKTLMKFENDRWYKIRVQVRPEHIQCWIDGVLVVDKNIKGLKISLRNETLPSRPLGICCFESNVEYRNLQLKLLTPKP